MSIEDLAHEVAVLAVRDTESFKRFNQLVILKAIKLSSSSDAKKKLTALLGKSFK
jgi:hypothetical protein